MNFPFGVYAHTRRSHDRQELKGMLRMDWTSGWRKTCLTKSVCHSHFRGSIRSLTLESSKVLFGREITLKGDDLGNHLSVQMPTNAPFPTYHLQPCLTIFCTTIMLLQAKEGRDPSAALRKSLFEK